MISLSRQIRFSAGHRYYQPAFSDAENKKIFGRCYTEHGHGHNYLLEVTVTGAIDEKTGMIINLTDLDKALKEVIQPLDHQHLNFDVPYFKNVVPTTENIAKYCFQELKKHLTSVKLVRTRLYETEDLWADYEG